MELPEYKQEQIVTPLREWVTTTLFTLKEAAKLHGILQDIACAHRWGKSYFVILQQTLCNLLKARYWQVAAYYKRCKTKPGVAKMLPANMQSCVDALIAREHSRLLWNPKFQVNGCLGIPLC